MSRWPSCRRKAKWGARRSRMWTRYLTLVPQLIQSFVIALRPAEGGSFRSESGHRVSCLMTIITLTTGSVFIMWLGEQITERGIGNGMSLLIFTGIVVGLAARHTVDLWEKAKDFTWGPLTPLLMIATDHADGGGGRVHCLCGAQRAPHSGAVRQAHCRTKDDGRADYAPAVEGQRRRRDAGDFCFVDCDHSADGA